MPNGNQRTKPNQVSNTTSDPLVSPITTDEMAGFIGLSTPVSIADDATLGGMLLSASQYYVDYHNVELLARNYTLKADHHPLRQDGFTGLGYLSPLLDWWITFPVWPVTSVTDVAIDGDLSTDYTTRLDAKPSTIDVLKSTGDIVINYRAGYESAAEIPSNTLTGIKMMVAYMYEHRGACDASQAANDSGANMLWSSSKVILSL